ncbi:flagellar biosynthesis anti-sigma factor FlgM [Oceanobacillus halotolerans]|uniref:flagellar biosynthesis anti-sigma factor FlgM n=1 Tax=Oceanobacillus halotolerans TaxID=2663380 RepID=UPI0013D9E913|nr:flagellar biosynthesis anti-sigma factor FlgM [Oceanobacillus halotolerans]
MKIYGPNQSNMNPYQKHIQNQQDYKQNTKKADQLQISNEAKKLQETEKPSAKRQAYVEDIKQQVESGDYQVNYEKTAQKMIHFWSKG